MTPLKLAAPLLAAFLLAGCTSTGSSDPEPIPGSITYKGQPRTKLTQSPPGSYLYNEFFNSYGERVRETYILQQDRSLRLMRREIIQYPPS